jgi:glycosyltransferase involved in cell wall biosynthesis
LDAINRSAATIDVVIPAFNEAANIGVLLDTLFERFSGTRYRFEAIVVDDGSRDTTSEVVKEYLAKYPITLIRLTRNFGKEAALLAGLDAARGDATIIMDADLQHPIEMIDRFLEKWEEGYQCVYGVKQSRRGEPFIKRVMTRVFYRAINSDSKVEVVPNALDFRLLDRVAVQALCSIRERVRFTKGLYAWLGLRSIGIPFEPRERVSGKSRFGGGALVRLGWDGLTSFSDLPLRLCFIVGSSVAVAAIFYGLWIAVRTLVFGVDVPGWATLTDALMFMGGLQLLFLGVLGEYVRAMFLETKQRPNYLVQESLSSITRVSRLATPAVERMELYATRREGASIAPAKH